MLNCLNHLLLGKRTQRAGKLYSVSVSKAEKKPQRLAVFLSRKPGEKTYGRLLQNILGFFSHVARSPPPDTAGGNFAANAKQLCLAGGIWQGHCPVKVAGGSRESRCDPDGDSARSTGWGWWGGELL